MSTATLVTAVGLATFTTVSASEIMCHRNHRTTTSSYVFTSQAAESDTCTAWPAAKRSIDAASALPAGWYWHTPAGSNVIDHAVAADHVLDLFASHVAATDPVPVAAAAHSYISAKRAELRALAARTYDETVASTVTLTRSGLNRACGLPDVAAGPGAT